MRSSLKIIISLFVLFVTTNIFGFTYSDNEYNPYGYQSYNDYSGQNNSYGYASSSMLRSGSSGMEDLPCDPSLGPCPNNGMEDLPCDPSLGPCPNDGMEDLPCDPSLGPCPEGTRLSAGEGLFALLSFGLLYGIFKYTKRKRERE